MPSKNWEFTLNTRVPIPTGLIVLYNDVAANIPANWEQFTDPAGKAIKGGATAASTGGQTSTTEQTTNSTGGHTGSADFNARNAIISGSGVVARTSSPQGEHSHTCAVLYTPELRDQVLIKATDDSYELPANAALLSLAVRSDLTDITPTGKILAGSDGSESSNIAEVKTLSGLSGGVSHKHISGTDQGSSDSSSASYVIDAGTHTHTETTIVTDKIKRFYMGVYTNASGVFGADRDSIGMWESATPPDGWVVCDGTNGTSDLTDYFIGFDVSKINTADGDGSITASSTLDTGGLHTHQGGATNYRNNQYHTSAGEHEHEVTEFSESYEPEYYTLIFIKPKG